MVVVVPQAVHRSARLVSASALPMARRASETRSTVTPDLSAMHDRHRGRSTIKAVISAARDDITEKLRVRRQLLLLRQTTRVTQLFTEALDRLRSPQLYGYRPRAAGWRTLHTCHAPLTPARSRLSLA